jgi:hypothetical protein
MALCVHLQKRRDSIRADDGILLCAASGAPIAQAPRYTVWQRDQNGTDQQGGAGMDLPKNEKLSDHVQDYRNRHQVTDRRKRASQQTPSVHAVK